MRFEARDLPPYTVSVTEESLRVGNVYFKVDYPADDDMLVPTMRTLVFLGRGVITGNAEDFLFQDHESYDWGIRHDTASEDDQIQLHSFDSAGLGGIYEFEEALNELLRCSLRRSDRQSG